MDEVIADALSQARWGLLPYEPKADWVTERLDGISALLPLVEKPATERVDAKEDTSTSTCARHEVLLLDGGCVICEFERQLR